MNRYVALIKTVDTGSFSRAADELGYTQSAVSQMIKSLEEDLRTTLLIRSRHGISLTANGEELVPYIREICNAHRRLWERQKEMLGLRGGMIRIGSIASVSCNWLPELMRRFKEQHPGIQFFLQQQATYTEIARLVREGSVDLGFINIDFAHGLESISLANDEMMVVLPRDHHLTECDSISLGQLREEPFILLEEGEYNESLVFFGAQNQNPNIQYRVFDDYTIMAMIEKNLGVGILADIILQRRGYDVATRPLRPSLKRNLGVVYKDRSFLPVASRFFLDHVVEQFDAGLFTPG